MIPFGEFVVRQAEFGTFWSHNISEWVSNVPWTTALRQESLEDDLSILLSDRIVLPRYNSTRHKPWDAIITPDLEEVIMDRWGDDCSLSNKECEYGLV